MPPTTPASQKEFCCEATLGWHGGPGPSWELQEGGGTKGGPRRKWGLGSPWPSSGKDAHLGTPCRTFSHNWHREHSELGTSLTVCHIPPASSPQDFNWVGRRKHSQPHSTPPKWDQQDRHSELGTGTKEGSALLRTSCGTPTQLAQGLPENSILGTVDKSLTRRMEQRHHRDHSDSHRVAMLFECNPTQAPQGEWAEGPSSRQQGPAEDGPEPAGRRSQAATHSWTDQKNFMLPLPRPPAPTPKLG